MSGARPYLSSMTMNSVYSIPHARALVTARMADIARCFVAARFEPPEHQFPYYRVSVAPSGAVTSVAPPGTDPRCPRIDRCVARVFRAIPWGPTQAAEAGYFDLGFTARIRD